VLLGWAAGWPERGWAVEGARGLGHLLAQQLIAAGERVLDVPPKLAARVRLLDSGQINKNDPNDGVRAGRLERVGLGQQLGAELLRLTHGRGRALQGHPPAGHGVDAG
jgi:hypothetical protein